MKPLNIEPARSSPAVQYNASINKFSVIGVSTMSNAREFYDEVLEWMNESLAEIPDNVVFEFHLPYFNSASNKCLYTLIERIKELVPQGRRYEISWCVEEDDEFMKEGGEAIEELLDLTFTFTNKPFNQTRLF